MSTFYAELQQYVTTLVTEFDQIPESRKDLLRPLGLYCQRQQLSGKSSKLIVICTHNSRRSHMGQLWLAAAAHYYGLDMETYSGGTEGTAFNPRAVKAMQEAGFQINKKTTDSNPRYLVSMHPQDEGQVLYSKCYDEKSNPSAHFAAIMVCSEADKDCPIILGADQRFSIPYHDPKAFDDTDREEEAYAERCRDIGREVFYALSLIGDL